MEVASMGNLTSSKSVDNPSQCVKLRITYNGNGKGDGLICVKHMSINDQVMSECYLSPEEAYEYANSIMRAYDDISGID
jgi:hypothetical protein